MPMNVDERSVDGSEIVEMKGAGDVVSKEIQV